MGTLLSDDILVLSYSISIHRSNPTLFNLPYFQILLHLLEQLWPKANSKFKQGFDWNNYSPNDVCPNVNLNNIYDLSVSLQIETFPMDI